MAAMRSRAGFFFTLFAVLSAGCGDGDSGGGGKTLSDAGGAGGGGATTGGAHSGGTGGSVLDSGPSCAADLASDVAHCGRCGHDCLGGACVAGVCQAVTLASGLGTPTQVVVDSENVYWLTTTGSIGACAKTGCPNGPKTIGTASKSSWLVLDVDHIYWGDYIGKTINRCPKTGCNGSPMLWKTDPYLGAFAIDSDVLYWGANPPANSQLSSCPTAGCGAAPSALYGTTTHALGTIGVRNGELFFVTGQSGILVSELYKCPASGCSGAPTLLGKTGQDGYMGELHVDDNGVVITIGAALHFKVYQCGAGGCGGQLQELMWAIDSYLVSVGIDATHLYAILGLDPGDGGGGKLVRCSRKGCGDKPEPITTLGPAPAGCYPLCASVAVDDKALYFSDPAAGKIVKLAKP